VEEGAVLPRSPRPVSGARRALLLLAWRGFTNENEVLVVVL
jgi:hypothetical protein